MHLWPLGPAQQHHLVAAGAPRIVQGMADDGLPKSATPIVRVRHHILDERVRPPAASEVRDNDQAAGRDEPACTNADDATETGLAKHSLPDFVSLWAIRYRIVGRVQMLVQLDEGRKVVGLRRSNCKLRIKHLTDSRLPNAMRLTRGGCSVQFRIGSVIVAADGSSRS